MKVCLTWGKPIRSPAMGMRMIVWFVGIVGVAAAAVGCGTEASEPELLTRRDPEPRGERCKLGGTAIHAGQDENGNGDLDDAEIDRTEYLCDVSTTVLVRKDTLAPSLECPAGGLAVRTGIDDDADGALDDAEIDHTTNVCDSIELWDGDFTYHHWDDPLKVAALRGARVVTGSLEIRTESATLPLLELVTGNLNVYQPASELALPALRRVGGNAAIRNPASATELPMLAGVGGNLHVSTGAAALELPALTEVGGNLEISAGTGAITFDTTDATLRVHGEVLISGDCSRVAAPRLTTIDGRLRTWYTARGTLSLPGLQTVGDELRASGMIGGLQLAQLTSIGGGLIIDTAQPISLALPSL